MSRVPERLEPEFDIGMDDLVASVYLLLWSAMIMAIPLGLFWDHAPWPRACPEPLAHERHPAALHRLTGVGCPGSPLTATAQVARPVIPL